MSLPTETCHWMMLQPASYGNVSVQHTHGLKACGVILARLRLYYTRNVHASAFELHDRRREGWWLCNAALVSRQFCTSLRRLSLSSRSTRLGLNSAPLSADASCRMFWRRLRVLRPVNKRPLLVSVSAAMPDSGHAAQSLESYTALHPTPYL